MSNIKNNKINVKKITIEYWPKYELPYEVLLRTYNYGFKEYSFATMEEALKKFNELKKELLKNKEFTKKEMRRL